MLLEHVPQGHCDVFSVLSLCTLQTHGCFTRLAVKLHHLQMVQWSKGELNVTFAHYIFNITPYSNIHFDILQKGTVFTMNLAVHLCLI